MSRRTRALPALVVESEETRVEKFGRFLYETFQQTVRPSISDLQLRQYGDYLHHFGFSIERESRARRSRFLSSAITLQGNSHVAPPHDTSAMEDEVTAHAGWGIAAAERDAADLWARTVGPLEGLTKPEEVTARLVEPFEQVTWRQSATQCAMKKARTLYCWLCENVTVELSSPGATAVVEGGTTVAATKKNNEQRGGVPARGAKRRVGVETQPVPTPVEVVDPLVEALQRRTADPRTLALLYQKCLQHANLKSLVVEGRVRVCAPEESVEWAWNIVYIPQENKTELQYLVDVALSSYTGPLRPTPRGNDAAAAATATAEEAEAAKAVTLAETLSVKSKRSTFIQEEKKSKRGILDGPVLVSSSSLEKRIEDFYFNTHPLQFRPTHFPNEGPCMLLMLPPRKTSWESAPCLTHNFFRFPLTLVSHRRRCTFTVRSTPFYVSLVNERPERTELCCFLFKGALSALPEDHSTATPLGSQWVWHQREESTGCETFTIMAPEAGYYSVVIGAREIRKDPFSAVISEDPFVSVVAYQVLVTFVSHQVPHLPRQHFSPSVCKLLAPLVYQVPEGSVRFVVMPSCANVSGVAIVSKCLSDESRKLVAFLPFSFELVAYAGNVTLTGGCEAEVWILYAAPDHNYMNATGLPRLAPSSMPHDALTRSEIDGNRAVGQQGSQGGLFFLPFVTCIEVTKLTSSADAGHYIQPQLSMETEQQPTLRRLIGVTPELYREATAVVERTKRPVGSYFEAKQSLRK